MKHTLQAILFGCKEPSNWNTMKYVLISGFIVTAVWTGIGDSTVGEKFCKIPDKYL